MAREHVEYREATAADRSDFFERILEQLGADSEGALAYLGLSLAELRSLFETRGEVRSVWADAAPVGHLWIELRDRVVHVHAVILLPHARGRGIGTAAFDALSDEFRSEADWIELGAQERNGGALRFYERLGFRESGPDTAPGFRVLRRPIGPVATD